MSSQERAPKLSMQLDVGLTIADLFEAEILIGEALDVDLILGHDLELGGAYFFYEPENLVDIGLSSIRIRQNYVESSGWHVSCRQDLSLIAEVSLISTSLLEIGRVANSLLRACESQCDICEYVISINESSEFWRAHWVELNSNENAMSTAMLESGHNDKSTAQDFLCYLAFGLESSTLSEAKNLAESILKISFDRRRDSDLDHDFLFYTPHDSLTELRLRENYLSPWTWLYPNRKECQVLLELTFYTGNLLELGNITANLEEQSGQVFSPLAYRAFGDLLRDHIPRSLIHEFDSLLEASPTWCLGHKRHQRSYLLEESEED